MKASDVKVGAPCVVKGIEGFSKPEAGRVLRPIETGDFTSKTGKLYPSETWFHVRFLDGAVLTVHPNNFMQ